MSVSDDSDVLSLLQPDLLTVEELVSKIQSRCRIKNLGLMSKEGLVELFRRVILPLPQRFYRANRRGKMLSSRRAKAGLETKRKDEGCTVKDSRVSTSNNRLKPPPTASTPSHRIRLSSNQSDERTLDNIQINNRKKLCSSESRTEDRRKESETGSSTGRKITLKRSNEEKSTTDSMPPSKSKRNVIQWP